MFRFADVEHDYFVVRKNVSGGSKNDVGNSGNSDVKYVKIAVRVIMSIQSLLSCYVRIQQSI